MTAVLDPATLALFCAAALALLVVPGPAVLYVVARSVEHGRTAGLVSVLGIHAGTVVHVAAAVAGLSALLASSTVAFEAVRYAGAAYLIALGVLALLRRNGAGAAPSGVRASYRRLFVHGAVVQVLNPKTAVFFLAFLPQFAATDAGHVPLQLAVLGLVFIALGLLSDGAYALAAGTAGNWFRASAWYLRLRRYVSGTVYLGLGVAAAVSAPRRS